MRPSHDMTAAAHTADRASATPIYDALYAEYRRSFRALPGDHTGEEELSLDAMRRIWGRTTAPAGHWEPMARGPQHTTHYQTRGHFPAALPPSPRDMRPHGR